MERFIKIIAVGKMKDRNLAVLTDDFMLRLRKYGKCELTLLPDSDIAREGEAICRELDKERNAAIFILSEEGKEITLFPLYDNDLCVFGSACVLRPVTCHAHLAAEVDTEMVMIQDFSGSRHVGRGGGGCRHDHHRYPFQHAGF